MDMKGHILAALREQFDRWQALLATLPEAQITDPQPSSDRSIKDDIAHLWTWQQRSIARLEAARLNREPVYPQWLPGLDPDAEGSTDRTNAWIYETNREQPWRTVYQNWQNGFRRFLELGGAISEIELLDGGRYPWLEGYPLAVILLASYDHHQEHLDQLLARQQRQLK